MSKKSLNGIEDEVKSSSNLRLLHELFYWGKELYPEIISELKTRYKTQGNNLLIKFFILSFILCSWQSIYVDLWHPFESNEREIRKDLRQNVLVFVLFLIASILFFLINALFGFIFFLLVISLKVVFTFYMFIPSIRILTSTTRFTKTNLHQQSVTQSDSEES